MKAIEQVGCKADEFAFLVKLPKEAAYMSGKFNSINSRRRALLTKLLALGVCVAAGGSTLSMRAMAQSCDRCASMGVSSADPSCGCESPRVHVAKHCATTCAPKLSFAQKFLKKLDRIGDEIECKLAKPKTKVTHCESVCESLPAREPSCGCESCVNGVCDTAPGITGVFAAPPRPTTSFPDNPQQHAVGSIGDRTPFPPATPFPSPTARSVPIVPSPKQTPLPPIERGTSPSHSQVQQRSNSNGSDVAVPSLKPVPESRPPFANVEKALPKNSTSASPRALGEAPSDTQTPVFEKRRAQPLPNALPPSGNEESLPDVLVDPFKDDPSAQHSQPNQGEIQLTSGRRTSKLGYKLKTALGDESRKEMHPSDAPAALTPAQRDVHPLEFESISPVESAPSESLVVPTAYHVPVPVKTMVRKPEPVADDESKPSVSRIRVPRR